MNDAERIKQVGTILRLARLRVESVASGNQPVGALGPAAGWLEEAEHHVERLLEGRSEADGP